MRTEFKKGEEVLIDIVPEGIARIINVEVNEEDDDVYYTLEVVVCAGDDVLQSIEDAEREAADCAIYG